MRQVLLGQSEAFAPLVERYLPAVYAVSYAYLGNHADAEDVAQETFVSAYTSLHTLKEPRKFEGWVVSIARQTASKLRRKQRRESAATAALSTDAIHQPDPGREELRRLLRAEIERMDDEPREVLLLHYHAGMNAREIAAALDINREAAKKRLQRARQSLSENLLAVIGEEGKPKTDYGRQRNAIMGLVAAACVGWGTSAAASAGSRGLASFGFPMKLGGGALAAFTVLGVVYAIAATISSRVPSEGGSANEGAATQVAPERPTIAEEAAAVSNGVTMEKDADEPGESLEEGASTASLTGYWRACNLVTNGGFFGSWNGKSDIVYLEQINDDVTLYIMSNGEIGAALGQGSIEGDQFRLAIPVSDGPMIGQQMSIKSGPSNPEAAETEPDESDIAPAPVPTSESLPAAEVAAAQNREEAEGENDSGSIQELVCTGSLSDGDSMMLSCTVEGGSKKPPFTDNSEFTRLTERDVAELRIMVQRIHEMEKLANALKAYRTANESALPEELSGLNDGYLDSPQLTVSGGSRIIEYNPDGPVTPAPIRSESMTEREFLIQWEEDARAAWPEFPGIPPMVLIRYSTPPMVLQFSDADPHSVERVDPGNRLRCSSSPPALSSPETRARHIEACQNNMKQLGLVLQMYSNDSRERRSPAGWAMLYPEYIRDLDILTCPSLFEGHAGRTLSYDLLFPTMNEGELVILGEEMGLEADDEVALKHKVPAIIENHPCADGKSRNVVFWDGHAERIEDSDWARLIAPFVVTSDAYRARV